MAEENLPKPIQDYSNFCKLASEKVKSDLKSNADFEIVEVDKEIFEIGWQFECQSTFGIVHANICLKHDFPYTPPKVYISEKSRRLIQDLPHVESDYSICLYPSTASFDLTSPIELFHFTVKSSKDFFSKVDTEEFSDEFYSYWQRDQKENFQLVFTSPPENLPSKPYAAFSGKSRKRAYIAASKGELEKWASNAQIPLNNTIPSLVIPIKLSTIPADFPSSTGDLIGTLAHDDEVTKWLQHCLMSNDYYVIILKHGVEGKPLFSPILGQGRNLAKLRINGFRLGKAPFQILYPKNKKQIDETPIVRGGICRPYHEWIHFRGGLGKSLKNKRVVVIGGGSLGGYVAQQLTRLGIGEIHICDPDLLQEDNIGRHFLGYSEIYQNKATALAEQLSKQMPHLEIKGHADQWQKVMEQSPIVFECDLIISLTADWSSDFALMKNLEDLPPVIFGWLENFAVAAHCLLPCNDTESAFNSFNEFGRFEYAVSEFATDTTIKAFGDCSFFQQYNPINAIQASSMICENVKNYLSDGFPDSNLQTWISSIEKIEEHGGKVSDHWKDKISPTDQSFTIRTNFPVKP